VEHLHSWLRRIKPALRETVTEQSTSVHVLVVPVSVGATKDPVQQPELNSGTLYLSFHAKTNLSCITQSWVLWPSSQAA